ncbi:DUF3769 domain-containing protein [Prochlorococcus marinus]|uniref:DUF3769 domain-containing protein n=1 Tax=Prochlorococcus marinus TaxID=1219 RepID=UPI0039B5AF09
MALNLGLLGFNLFLSLFETSRAKEHFLENSVVDKHYNFSVGNLVETDKRSSSRNLENHEVTFLTLKIFADKQYDYDQNIYLAEGNVKALINGGTLRSDLLSYDKSTGILSAEGNIRFRKGGQYFRAKEFKFNLLKKEGSIKDAYGILDLKNVLNDLKIDAISNQVKVENSTNDKEINTYDDGIEFSFGNIKLPDNKITRSNKSIGLINNWRFKSNSINIQENGWKSNRIVFTNDPFDSNQISFEGIDVIAEEEEEEDGRLIITSSKTYLILDNRSKIFIGKRTFGRIKKERKYKLKYDNKDRDGFYLVRKMNSRSINNIKIESQPQFLFNRALLGKKKIYENNKIKDNRDIKFSDLFGLNLKINANYKDWIFDINNDFATLNPSYFFDSLRHSASLKKSFKMPIINDSNLNIFNTYRSRAWNGTMGETEIKSGYGGFIEKTKAFKTGEINNYSVLRFGTAKYEAERLNNNEQISLWRNNLFASLDSSYDLWKRNSIDLNDKDLTFLSPIQIYPEFVLRTNINTAYYKYEDGSDQAFLKFSAGPEIRLGKLEKNFLDYTRLYILPAFKIRSGNSPFKFDNATDLRIIHFGFMQQLYGPLVIDIESNINIDGNSINYGKSYGTNLGLSWQKRAYEFGIYYQPSEGFELENFKCGVYFRLNGFKFANSTKAIF